MTSTIRSLTFLLAAATIVASFVSCSSRATHGVAATSKVVGAVSPTPIKTPYLGIFKMWKGHVQSLNRNVLVVWAKPDSGANWTDTSNKVFGGIVKDVERTDLQIVVINVVRTRGIYTRTESDVLVNNHGVWEPTKDANLIDKIILAGLGP
jgi:hypothetical protein